MAVVSYSKQQLIERIQKHFNNGFPGEDWKISNREMLLYIDQAIPIVMRGQMYEGAKIQGVFEVPNAYIVRYNYTISTFDNNTKEWHVTLAQPPLALPTGYDITQVYVGDGTLGQSMNGLAISSKRAGWRRSLPVGPGFQFRVVNGNKLYMRMWDGSSMQNFNLYVELPVSRTDSLTDELHIPDDAIEGVFQNVYQKILSRYQIPQDTVKDNLMPGNKTA